MRLILPSILSISSILSAQLAWSSHAVIGLKNGSKLSGELSSIDSTGNIKIHSPLSNSALEITHSSILEIAFPEEKVSPQHTSERVHLNNGDSLPCALVSLDKSSMSLSTWYAGDLKIPTSTVSNIEFHTTPDSLIYSGPSDNDIWRVNSNWSVKASSLRCIGKGEIAQNFELPENFTFKSTVTWESSRPLFNIHFCADSNRAHDMVDYYSIEFSSNGIHIIRSSKVQARAQIGEIPLRLRELPSNELDIELHVDRRTQTISVSINGDQYGVFDDTSFRVPSGNSINFESRFQQNTDSLTVANISISQWKGSNLTFGNDLGELDLQQDTLFDTEGLRYTGDVQQLSIAQKKLNFGIKHASHPMLVPLSKIQSLYFARSKSVINKDHSENYSIKLQGGGSLTVESITFTSKQASAVHPILGKISLLPGSLHKITSLLNTDE